VTSVVPTFTAEQLRAATASNPPGEQYRSLPEDFNQDLRTLAAAATAGAATPYDQAVALQNYFRTNFTYNVNVSRGHSIRSIEAFINAGRILRVVLSVSFARLARTLGLPTRVAVGSRPATRTRRRLARTRQACPRLARGLVRRSRLGAVRADAGARRAGW
jgi:transglutaminase-like putative cysteine protease